jgi:hypothetical protein
MRGSTALEGTLTTGKVLTCVMSGICAAVQSLATGTFEATLL